MASLVQSFAALFSRSSGSSPGRANRAIYQGKQLITGHHITFSDKKTKRCWKPHVIKRVFSSELLDARLPLRVTHVAMRTIDKYGSLDNYLCYGKPHLFMDSELAVALRHKVHEAYTMQHGAPPSAYQFALEQRKAAHEERAAVRAADPRTLHEKRIQAMRFNIRARAEKSASKGGGKTKAKKKK
eukprot:CAMPEP_0177660476 /NCGR_PEP_ID=MMETSP0447-20121125/18064_1 /TAXON_ID=0 /ORGANISM="Stygamoeba regulata, Strain BSH-02190019" /LENGTH=184 /DNA_ID=CAMNT_0019165551 /DNA_START=69 /DNA_END=623 /DNA_ORIENTATION=+